MFQVAASKMNRLRTAAAALSSSSSSSSSSIRSVSSYYTFRSNKSKLPSTYCRTTVTGTSTMNSMVRTSIFNSNNCRLISPQLSSLLVYSNNNNNNNNNVMNNLMIGQPLPTSPIRYMMSSTTATATMGGSSSSSGGGNINHNNDNNTNNNNNENNKKKNDDNPNIFLDNLGKIFLATIGAIIATLVRSSANTVNRNKVRDYLQDTAILDPIEIEDLRIANSKFTPDVFRSILEDLQQNSDRIIVPSSNSTSIDGTIVDNSVNVTNNTGRHMDDDVGTVPVCTYNEFVFQTRKTMARLKGTTAFTVQLGHMIDRVAVDVMTNKGVTPDTPLPVTLWLVALSLGLDSSVKDRIRILYEILQFEQRYQQDLQGHEHEQHHRDHQDEDGVADKGDGRKKNEKASSSSPSSKTEVVFGQIPPLVGYLQATCQLPPDTQIIPTETKYPTQQWVRGTPRDLVPWENGTDRDVIDLQTFASILRSKSVCAWGECYQRRKFNQPDDV